MMTRNFYLFFLCFFCVSLEVLAQLPEDCVDARALVTVPTLLSDIDTITIDSLLGVGNEPAELGTTPVETCGPTGYTTRDIDKSYWFSFSATTSGSLEFMIFPENLDTDYDFAIWEGVCPNNPCSKPIFCSWQNSFCGEGIPYTPTGMAVNPIASFGVDPVEVLSLEIYMEAIPLQAGKNYFLLVENRNEVEICGVEDSLGFTILFDGTATVSAPIAEPTANIIFPSNASTFGVCENTSAEFAITNIADAEYIWTTPDGTVLMGESQRFINLETTSGQLCVEVTCPIQEKFCWEIQVDEAPNLQPRTPENTLCNSLVLTDYVEDINSVAGDLTLFGSEADALLLQNPIDPSLINSQGEFWIRKITASAACFSNTIRVTTTPIFPKLQAIPPIGFCEDVFDLTSITIVELNGFQANNDLATLFYNDSLDAANDVNPITVATEYGTYWVKGISSDDCFDITPLVLFDNTPEIIPTFQAVSCNVFDFSTLSLMTASGEPLSETTYFNTETDAENNINPLPSTIVEISKEYWVRGAVANGCFDVMLLPVTINKPTIVPIQPTNYCGENFDLSTLNLTEINGTNLAYTFYSNSEDAITSSNPIRAEVTAPGVYWSRGDSDTGCFDTTSITIISNNPTINSPGAQNQCGSTYDLTNLSLQEATGMPLTYTFYDTFEDALSNRNQRSEIINTPGTYSIRGINEVGCSDIISITINLTVPNILPDGAQRLDNGTYDLRQVRVLNLETVEPLTGLTYYADSLSAVNGVPQLPSTVVNQIATYWIKGFVNGCPVITPIDVLAESVASLILPSLPPFELPCTGDCINLATIISGEAITITNPNLTFQFFATVDAAEDGIAEDTLTSLEFCDPTNVWVRGTDTNNEFGVAQIRIQEMTRLSGTIISGDRPVCKGDSTNLLFSFNGNAPFEIVYTDGIDLFEKTVEETTFEQAVAPEITTTYSLISATDVNNCTALVGGTSTFSVAEKVAIDNINVECNELQTEYTVSFDIVSGDLNSMMINDNDVALTGNRFTSDPIDAAIDYQFIISDDNDCPPFIQSGSFICTCSTEAAEMDRTLIEVCEGEVVLATIEKEGVLSNTDRVFYVLHDSETQTLGNVLGVTDEAPEFIYTSNLELDTTYYISTVITKVDALGIPIWDANVNSCIGVSAGTPIRFAALPEVSLTLEKNIACPEEPVLVTFEMNGDGPYDIEFYNGTTTETLTNILNGHTLEISGTKSTVLSVEAISWSTLDNCMQTRNKIDATLDIHPPLSYDNFNLTCNDTGSEFVISFEIVGGNATTYQVNGNAATIVGNVFTSGPILHESTYRFELTDANNCTGIVIEDIGECDCTADITTTIATLQAISCPDVSDGSVQATAMNGLPPYSFQWQDGSTGEQLNNLSAGWVAVSMTDGNGCEVTDSLLLEAPDPLVLDLEINEISCFGDNNGSIIISDATGGNAPYNFTIDPTSNRSSRIYGSLAANTYTIYTTDSQGCQYQENVEINQPDKLEVSLQENKKLLNLGDSLQLQAIVNQNIVETVWQTGATLSCQDCLNPIATPTETSRYQVTVTTVNGCTATDEITIRLENNKSIYRPTGFTPNGDGINDFFGLFSGNQVRAINTLKIFSRWGALIYERSNVPVSITYDGWDGTDRNGQKAPSGIYLYYAEVLFADGTTEIITGDVALVR